MFDKQNSGECRKTCWIVAVVAGLVIMILLYVAAGFGGFAAFLLGIIAGLLVAYFLPQFVCGEETAVSGTRSDTKPAQQASNAGTSTQGAASGATATGTDDAAANGASDASMADTTTSSTGGAAAASASAAATTASPLMAAEIKPSKSLGGEAELASRKGEWKYEHEATAEKKPAVKKVAAKKAAPKKTVAAEKATPKKAAVAKKAEPKKAAAAKKAATTKTTAPKAEATKTAAKASAPKKATAPKKVTAAKKPAAAPKVTAPAKAKRAPVAADGQPQIYTSAPAGGGDDLKLISGVGPKLEQTLNDIGIYQFDQVGAWRKKEIEWVDARLRFKGRIERDDWMSQAKILAKGGETEFSKRSKK